MFYANTNAIVLKGLEHLQILVSMGLLEPICQRYGGTTTLVTNNYRVF
jgi:hypothetical protein